MSRFITLIMTSVVSATALAAEPGASTAASPVKFADPATLSTATGSTVSNMGQVTVALVMVLAVLFGIAWAMRQFKLFNRRGQGNLEILQGISVGPKERAVLIKVNGHRLLLGVAPGCVNLLLQLPATGDEAAADNIDQVVNAAADAASANHGPGDFKALLKRTLARSLGQP